MILYSNGPNPQDNTNLPIPDLVPHVAHCHYLLWEQRLRPNRQDPVFGNIHTVYIVDSYQLPAVSKVSHSDDLSYQLSPVFKVPDNDEVSSISSSPDSLPDLDEVPDLDEAPANVPSPSYMGVLSISRQPFIQDVFNSTGTQQTGSLANPNEPAVSNIQDDNEESTISSAPSTVV